MKQRSLVAVSFFVYSITAFAQKPTEAVKCDANQITLASLSNQDDKNGKLYSFAICSSEASKQIQVKAHPVTGTNLSTTNLKRIVQKAAGKPMVLWGSPYVPTGKEDHRRVEYRVTLTEEKKYNELEIHLITLNKDGTAKEPKHVRIGLSDIGFLN